MLALKRMLIDFILILVANTSMTTPCYRKLVGDRAGHHLGGLVGDN